MSEGALLDLWRGGLSTVAIVAAPIVLTALAVGLITALLQAATQLQEGALSFIPKIVAVGVVLAIGGSWVLGQLADYTRSNLAAMAEAGRGASR